MVQRPQLGDPERNDPGVMLIPDFATMLEGYAEIPRGGRRILRWAIILAPVSLGVLAILIALLAWLS